MLLAADAGEGRADDAVLALVIVDGQDAAPGRIRDLLDFVARDDPLGLLPAVLLFDGSVLEGFRLFQFIDLRHVLHALKAGGRLEGKFGQGGFLAAGIEDETGNRALQGMKPANTSGYSW